MQAVELVLERGENEVFVGGGAVSRKLSRNDARQLLAEGFDPSLVKRACEICVIESGEIVVTVLRDNGLAGRRYRRQLPTLKVPRHQVRAAA